MLSAETKLLSGWGRYPVEQCTVYRPEKRTAVGAALSPAQGATIISRGLGRSYGDAALNRGGGVLSHERLNRFLSFDVDTGVLECEAGASLEEIIQTFLPRGWMLPVTPGTKCVTVGGAIASDVHGKNHHVDGTFARFVAEIRLQIPSGEVLVCSPDENRDVFWATVGGMGLTGAIISASVRLRRVESAYVVVHHEKARNLEGALSAFADGDGSYRYSVAWIDCLARGRSLGRSVLMRGNDASADRVRAAGREPLRLPRRRTLTVPVDAPAGVLNRYSVAAFNALYWARHRNGADRLADYESFFYPLDGLHRWNRLYGRRGFAQYQAAFPLEQGEAGIRRLLEHVSDARRASFLAVLKRFGPSNEGLLSFPVEGFTLALDLPAAPGIREFLRKLDTITLDHGGRVYLAKDAVLTPEAFAVMYPRAEEFRRIKGELDPDGKISSSLARRVGLVEG